MSRPPRRERSDSTRAIGFIPHYLLRDAFGWLLVLGVLAALAALFPWELGEKADPFAPAYADIRPEWYFMFMFETLKLVPGGEVAGVEYEAIPILLFGLGGAGLMLWPLLDRRRAGPRPQIVTAIGALVLAYVVGMTAWGYRSLMPIWISLATLAVLATFGYLTHRLDRPSRRS